MYWKTSAAFGFRRRRVTQTTTQHQKTKEGIKTRLNVICRLYSIVPLIQTKRVKQNFLYSDINITYNISQRV